MGHRNVRRSNDSSGSAIAHLHRHGLFVVGGLIVGNPDGTRQSIEANLAFARRWVDWPYIQHPTPYPGTPMTEEFRRRSLIVDEDVAHYDGTTAVVRSQHVDGTFTEPSPPQHVFGACSTGVDDHVAAADRHGPTSGACLMTTSGHN